MIDTLQSTKKTIRPDCIPEWLEQMVETREVMRQTLGSEYDSMIAPFRAEIDAIVTEESCTPLAATRRIMSALLDVGATYNRDENYMASQCGLAMSAGLDATEKAEGIA